MAGILENRNKEAFDVYLYSYGIEQKDVSRSRVENACEVFRNIRELSDEAAAQQILADEIDILVDLKGYTQEARLGIQAFRPAPIIVSWLGYPGTLGHERLADYIIGDATVTPLEHAAHFSETLALMPHCYQPNDDKRSIGTCPTRAEVGLPENSFVFATFNQSYKITPEMFDIWCKLLAAVPNSVLWILEPHEVAQENLRREMTARGVDSARLIFAAKCEQTAHLGRLQLADLAVDTFPYTSHTTASDALWAGVPLVTKMGETFASRVAASILKTMDLAELVSDNDDDYFNVALDLAQNFEKLAAIKQKIATQKQTSPLFDTALFAKDLEHLYQTIWAQELKGKRKAVVLETEKFKTVEHIPLYYWKGGDFNNLGDYLGKYIVEKLTGQKVKLTTPLTGEKVYITVGSILGVAKHENCIVWGAGFMNPLSKINENMNILAVRGSLTLRNLPASYDLSNIALGDPALILPLVYPAKKTNKVHKLGIIPHFSDQQDFLNRTINSRKKLGDKVYFFNIATHQVEEFCDKLLQCELIVSSSLHGIILAHAYNIPALWVHTSNTSGIIGGKFKFHDYFSSVSIPIYDGLNLPDGEIDCEELIEEFHKKGNYALSRINNFNVLPLLLSCPFISKDKAMELSLHFSNNVNFGRKIEIPKIPIHWIKKEENSFLLENFGEFNYVKPHKGNHSGKIESIANQTNNLGLQPLWDGYGNDGATRMPNQVRTVSYMGNLYTYLTQKLQPQIIVEFGTAFGVSGMYFLAGIDSNKKGKLLTFEPNAVWAKLAESNLLKISNQFELTVGTFEDNINSILQEEQYIDLAFIDAIHTKEFVISQLDIVISKSRSGAIIILDDINFSDSMKDCWVEVSTDNRFSTSLTFGDRVGVLELKK